MSDEDTIFTDEELQNIETGMTAAAAGCSLVAGPSAPTCWAVAGALTGAIVTVDWLWDEVVPDSAKAVGVFDWQSIYDPIFKFCVESHANAVASVDAAWADMHGVPPGPSPAGAFLNDWIHRNGWQNAAHYDFKVDGKMRWVKLVPEKGPWAIRWGPLPKRADAGGKEAFARTIMNMLTSWRLSVLQRGVQEAINFTALSLTGSTWKVNAGSIREAVWVHGTSVKPEQRKDLSGARVFGSGARFFSSPDKSHWFHAQIPTPVLIDDTRPVCSKVFLMFRTMNARLEALHVYDGPNRIANFDNLAFQGDHHVVFDPANARFLFPCPTVRTGLSLSAKFSFAEQHGENTDPYVDFTSAGADFNRSA